MARPRASRRSATLAKAAFLTPYLGLIGLQVRWHALEFSAPPLIVVLVLAPLLAPLPWLARRSAPRTPLVAAYLALGYFVHGVTEALVSPPHRMLALTETALCLWLFAAAPVARRAWGGCRG